MEGVGGVRPDATGPSRTPAEGRKAETQARIVEAAVVLFIERGYDGTTTGTASSSLRARRRRFVSNVRKASLSPAL